MSSSPRRVAVFCGSRFGSAPEYESAARELGASLAAHNIELVFGGTDCGLMGVVARAALEHRGQAVGIVPQSDAHFPVAPGVKVEMVASVAHRKARMLELSDAFVALPGGLGTLDELFDALALRAIEVHAKPIALLSVAGFYDPLLAFLDRTVEAGFIQAKSRACLWSERDAAALVSRLAQGFSF